MTTHAVRANAWIFVRLPNDSLKPLEVKPNSTLDIGKLGSFPAAHLIGRPYYYTYEIPARQPGEAHPRGLRIVSPAELAEEAGLLDDEDGQDGGDDLRNQERQDERAEGEQTPQQQQQQQEGQLPRGFDLREALTSAGMLRKDNRLTVDDASRQSLTQADIEALKASTDVAGKEIIEKILANHAGLEEKTAFSKAKYLLRKHKKYLKRFTVLPMELGTLMEWLGEKEPARIMEMREEGLGLCMAWANVHFGGREEGITSGGTDEGGNWLVVDETGGLVVAAMAERMDLLHVPDDAREEVAAEDETAPEALAADLDDLPEAIIPDTEGIAPEPTANGHDDPTANGHPPPTTSNPTGNTKIHRDFPLPSRNNTITLLHSAPQPNLSLLKYFSYDTSNPSLPTLYPNHPLHTHLLPLSWLQLLDPHADPTYTEPPPLTPTVLATYKSGKRTTYHRKRRRWARCRAIVDLARQPAHFEGLVVATHMDLPGVLRATLPLVRGGGTVVVYSPTAEPLVALMDLYSKERRTAYLALLARGEVPDEKDFPLDPRLLLGAHLQSSRVRHWQVLPGRTHPEMTGKGGAEGFVFTARRVGPLVGGVEARGNFGGKRRKVQGGGGGGREEAKD